jgi:hypothetical protein
MIAGGLYSVTALRENDQERVEGETLSQCMIEREGDLDYGCGAFIITTGAVDLLKRHSGIVWDLGRFAVFLRGEDTMRSGTISPPLFQRGCPGWPHSASRLTAMPGATQLTSPYAEAPPDTVAAPSA